MERTPALCDEKPQPRQVPQSTLLGMDILFLWAGFFRQLETILHFLIGFPLALMRASMNSPLHLA